MFEHAPDDWVYTDEILQGMESGDLSEVPRDHISAEMWMLVGEPDSAAANLLETVTEDPHVSPVFLFEPTFDSIRDHPTFLEALSVLNLEGRTPQRTPR